jgi:hypothetical protein
MVSGPHAVLRVDHGYFHPSKRQSSSCRRVRVVEMNQVRANPAGDAAEAPHPAHIGLMLTPEDDGSEALGTQQRFQGAVAWGHGDGEELDPLRVGRDLNEQTLRPPERQLLEDP